jgi:catechol 2,3-dioxygenase-like lactoylglutathione lyase family enzyme
MLTGFAIHATVAASDLARARAWYKSKLGLVPEVEDPGGLWYRFGDGTFLSVYQTEYAGTARNTQAGWTVTDIEKVMADLRDRGVVFEEYNLGNGLATVNGLLTAGPYRACWFKDSEGNTFEVSQVDR